MRRNGHRWLCMALVLALLAVVLPVTAVAGSVNRFVLVAEAGGALVIAPEYVTYAEGQTIGEALLASGHSFEGLEQGAVHTIDGVTGSYSRSDQDGAYSLEKPAAEVTHYRFSEQVSSGKPSSALQLLMTEMADYREEAADVQAAAAEAYAEACRRFVGADDTEAAELRAALADAVADYQAQQATVGTVTFSDGTRPYGEAQYPGVEIRMENPYGKVYTDDGDGELTVPQGTYDFTVSYAKNHIQGSVTVGETEEEVSAAMPTDDWLIKDSFRLSEGYGEDFEEILFSLGSWEGRSVQAFAPDSFSGTVYTYAEYDKTQLTAVPKLTAIYQDTTGEQRQADHLAFESRQVGPEQVLAAGAEGNSVVYRISAIIDAYTVSQDYAVEFLRIPTLSAITLQDQDGTDLAATESFKPGKTEYTYKILNEVTAVTVTPVPREGSYEVTVNGTPVTESLTVNLPEDGSDAEILVAVTGGSYTTTYTLQIQPGEGRKVTLITTEADVTVEVTNSNGLKLPFSKYRGTDTYNRYVYTLVPGETYYYVATDDVFYHATNSFTLEDAVDSTITVNVKTEDWLTELAFGSGPQSGKKGSWTLDKTVAPEKHEYAMVMEDTESNAYLWANCDKTITVQALYTQLHSNSLYHGVEKEVAITSGVAAGTQLQRLLMRENPYGNTLTVRLSRKENGVTYYQDYVVDITRTLSLAGLSAQCAGETMLLIQPDGTENYAPKVRSYTVRVPLAAETLELSVESYMRRWAGSSWNTCYGEETTGYRAFVDGVDVTEQETVSIALDGTLQDQTVNIRVTNDKVPELESAYVLTIQKAAPTVVQLEIMPETALLCVHERASGNRVWPADGTLLLSEGFTYDYTLTCSGYVGRSGTMEVSRDDNQKLTFLHNGEALEVTADESCAENRVVLALTLEKAPENTDLNKDLPAEWPDFRGNADNNGVTDVPIPYAAAGGTLYWARKLGSGTDQNAVGSPILVDGALITYAGNTLYRIDPVNGEILATGEMNHRSSFSITPPAYWEGMLFVALANGTVQAFDAQTLESLWIYADPLGGQPNSPITVCNGYLYTGFWNQEKQAANFVCLTVTDEKPDESKETKPVSWYHTRVGGYYWAGAYACENYVLVGADDGQTGAESLAGSLLLFDAATGRLLESWDGLDGDIRSTVSYDSVTDAFCFTSKGGTFYSVQVVQEENGWKLANKRQVALSNGVEGSVPESTSTPVVYQGRAYVGVCGTSQFGAYTGHNITVIDLTKMAIAYTVPTKGFPQTSGLLTTAYEESGYVYVCFVDNYTPGALRLLRDKAGQTAPSYVTVDGSHSLAYNLFAPSGSHGEYAICSPIADSYGALYFKNDSGHLMAFGSAVTALEVTVQPEKTSYLAGETFDPTGMVVMATYANGLTRDVTDYVTWNEEALTQGETSITVVFPHVLYHNEENGTAMKTGVVSVTPKATVAITVEEAVPATKMDKLVVDGDQVTVVFADGVCDTAWKIVAASYHGDGKLISCVSQMGSGKQEEVLELPGAAEAEEIRVFILYEDHRPVMAHGSFERSAE